MTVNRGLDKLWCTHIVEYDVAVENNADVYVVIQRDYLIECSLKKHVIEQSHFYKTWVEHLIWVYMCLYMFIYSYMYICSAHVYLLVCGEESIISLSMI